MIQTKKNWNQIILLKSHIQETLTLLMCADNSIVSKKVNKTFGSNLEHTPIFRALLGANPEQDAETIQVSNPEHLIVFKAPRGDNQQVQSGTPPCF